MMVYDHDDHDDEPVCQTCGEPILQSQTDPADPYWYCPAETCDWCGYIETRPHYE